MSSASCRSIGAWWVPGAEALVSAPSIQPPTGVALTKRSASSSGPRPLPSTLSEAWSDRLRMPPRMRVNCKAPLPTVGNRACRLRNSIERLSNTSSPFTSANAGQGGCASTAAPGWFQSGSPGR